jgi:hypothetical protein
VLPSGLIRVLWVNPGLEYTGWAWVITWGRRQSGALAEALVGAQIQGAAAVEVVV